MGSKWKTILGLQTKNKAAKIHQEHDLVQMWEDITGEIIRVKESSGVACKKRAMHGQEEKQVFFSGKLSWRIVKC